MPAAAGLAPARPGDAGGSGGDAGGDLAVVAILAAAAAATLCRLGGATSALLAVALPAEGGVALVPLELACVPGASFQELVRQCLAELRARSDGLAASDADVFASCAPEARDLLAVGCASALARLRETALPNAVLSIANGQDVQLRCRRVGAGLAGVLASALGALMGALPASAQVYLKTLTFNIYLNLKPESVM